MAAGKSQWIRVAWRNKSQKEQISMEYQGSRKSNEKGRSDCIN